MNLPDRLDRLFRPLTVPNLVLAIIAGQVFTFFLQLIEPTFVESLTLNWNLVLAGEVWRLATFVLAPPAASIFAIFYFWFFYFVGSAMQQIWGSTRLCSFIYLGLLFQIAVAATVPNQDFSALFIEVTLLLALATYQPDYEILIFVFPVKLKYLALIHVAGMVLGAFGSLTFLIMNLGIVGNYLVFFFAHWRDRSKTMRRRNANRLRTATPSSAPPRHVCQVCGIDSRTHPKMDFRYCSGCDNQFAYCEAHLRNHEHARSDEPSMTNRSPS